MLIKAKKLPPQLWERVDARFDLIHRTMEVEYHRKCVDGLLRANGDRRIDPDRQAEFETQLEQLDLLRSAVRAANEPSVLAEPPATQLADIAKRTFERPDGRVVPYLTADELRYLQLSTGTLDAA